MPLSLLPAVPYRSAALPVLVAALAASSWIGGISVASAQDRVTETRAACTLEGSVVVRWPGASLGSGLSGRGHRAGDRTGRPHDGDRSCQRRANVRSGRAGCGGSRSGRLAGRRDHAGFLPKAVISSSAMPSLATAARQAPPSPARTLTGWRSGTPVLNDGAVLFQQSGPDREGRHFGSRIVVLPDATLAFTIGDRANAGALAGPVRPCRKRSAHQCGWIHSGRQPLSPTQAPARRKSGPSVTATPRARRSTTSTGLLWTVEHGARGGDEINQPEAGRNYGWPTISYGVNYSGTRIGIGTQAEGLEQPVYYWDPSIAPSGMAIMHDSALFPGWQGDMLVGALRARMLVRLDRQDGAITGEETPVRGRFRPYPRCSPGTRTGRSGSSPTIPMARSFALRRKVTHADARGDRACHPCRTGGNGAVRHRPAKGMGNGGRRPGQRPARHRSHRAHRPAERCPSGAGRSAARATGCRDTGLCHPGPGAVLPG